MSLNLTYFDVWSEWEDCYIQTIRYKTRVVVWGDGKIKSKELERESIPYPELSYTGTTRNFGVL